MYVLRFTVCAPIVFRNWTAGKRRGLPREERMGRAIGAAVAGYVVMFVAVFLIMTVSWTAIGADGAFQPGIWEVTGLWLFLMTLAGVIAAIAGGYVTALISSHPRAVPILIGVVLVMSIVSLLPALTGGVPEPPLPRPSDVPMFEAMQNGQQPTWLMLLNPIIAIVGVLVGARLKRGGATS